MRKFLTASVLILALACPAFAGIMGCPPGSPQPLTDATEEVTEPDTQSEVADSLTETMLTLLESVLAIL